MGMITGGVVAQSISVAAELGIADLLSNQPRTTAQLASAMGVDSEKLYRLLRFLASLGIFQLGEDGAWGLTPLADVLRSDVPGSVRAGALLLGRTSSVTPFLLENIRTGQCAYDLAFGKTLFEDLSGKPELAAIFDAAMTSFHGGETAAVLGAYSYEGISTLADIGCGNGDVMVATLQRYPAMRGILFDQAHVIERTTHRWKRPELPAAARCGAVVSSKPLFLVPMPTACGTFSTTGPTSFVSGSLETSARPSPLPDGCWLSKRSYLRAMTRRPPSSSTC